MSGSLDDLLKHSTKMELVREIGELRGRAHEAETVAVRRYEEVQKAEAELQSLRADIAYVRGHLEGYADAIRIRLQSGEDLAQVLTLLQGDLREDAERLRQAGGGGS